VTPGEGSVRDRLDALFRAERTALLATLVRRCGGDFDLAEDTLSEAFTVALRQWSERGVPPNPAGWILTTARRRAIDRIRRADTFRRRKPLLVALSRASESAAYLPPEDDVIDDDRLRMVFACCHPALSIQAQVALTLRAVAGLSTREIARAFLVPDTTMAQRLVRAKRKVAGLLGLMLLHDARRRARTDAHGDLVLLEDQDRTQWDRARIAEGVDRVERALREGRSGPAGPYALQAAIAAVHCEARPPGRPTGRRSRRCTESWSASPAVPWSASTAPSRWRW